MAKHERMVRILFDSKKNIPAHAPAVLSAVSPSKRTLKLLAIVGDDKMKFFGLMEMYIAERAQRVPGQMARIGFPEGVDLEGTDRWEPGETIAFKFQHVVPRMTQSYDTEAGLGGLRRFCAVLVALETWDDATDKQGAEDIMTPLTTIEPIAVEQELFDILPHDCAVKVLVR